MEPVRLLAPFLWWASKSSKSWLPYFFPFDFCGQQSFQGKLFDVTSHVTEVLINFIKPQLGTNEIDKRDFKSKVKFKLTTNYSK
jgi:hypothetical protein